MLEAAFKSHSPHSLGKLIEWKLEKYDIDEKG
jgi:hypothetical protein